MESIEASLRSNSDWPEAKNSSTLRAHSLPSLMAHTTNDWPRRISPAAKSY